MTDDGDLSDLSVNADVVRQMLAIMTDETIDRDERIAMAENAPVTGAERLLALMKVSCDFLVDAGVMEEPQAYTVLDMTIAQVQTLAAVYGVVARWDVVLTRREMTLGNVIKRLPPLDADAVIRTLYRGGLLPPPVPEDPS